MTRRFALSLPILLAGIVASTAVCQGTNTQPPRLVVFITVDAMRADYLSRFAPQLTGGLGRLYKGGAVFTNGFQDHAITETAPGHSVIMSGRYPVHTGISANTAGVNDTTVTVVDAAGLGASPFRFRGTTLTDWLMQRTVAPAFFPFPERIGLRFFQSEGPNSPFSGMHRMGFSRRARIMARASRSGFVFSTPESSPRATRAKSGGRCCRTAPTVSRTAFR